MPERNERFSGFYESAFGDYLAARLLLLENLLPQGAAQSALAVEKIVKAILSLRGEQPDGHLCQRHFKSLNNFQPELYKLFSNDFIKFLRAAYNFRYLDGSRIGQSIVIDKYKTLSELDRIMCTIFSSLNIEWDGVRAILLFERAKTEKDSRLLKENYFLEDGNTYRYFEQRTLVVQIKIFDGLGPVTLSEPNVDSNPNKCFFRPAEINITRNAGGVLLSGPRSRNTAH